MLAFFAMANLMVFILAGVVWVRPAVVSLQDGRANVRMLERRYAVERRHVAEFEENLRELELLSVSRIVLSQGEKLPMLAGISHMGVWSGLENAEFTASEAAAGYFGSGGIRLVETRVQTEHVGCVQDVIFFLHELTDANGKIRSLTITTGVPRAEGARLRLDFSLFGRE